MSILVDDGVDVDPVDDLLHVDPVDDLLDVDPVDDLLHVDPVDDLLDVDPLDDLLDVHLVDQGVDVDGVDDQGDDALGQRLGQLLDPGADRVGAHGTPEPRDIPVIISPLDRCRWDDRSGTVGRVGASDTRRRYGGVRALRRRSPFLGGPGEP